MASKKLIILLIIAILLYFFLKDSIAIEQVIQHKEWLIDFTKDHLFVSVLVFILSCIILTNTPVPLAALSKMTSGLLFGVYGGIFLNILATTLAGVFGYFIVKKWLYKKCYRYFGSQFLRIEKEIEKNGFSYFLALRVMMVFPYFLIHIIAGFSRVRFRSYLLSTIIGVIPGSVIYALAGTHIETIKSPHDIISPETALILALMAIMSLIPVFIKRAKKRL
jgi:uncharacterized membrane protein YdjX (TVP38/TMEM64 family)